jgi:hypothetical protein
MILATGLGPLAGLTAVEIPTGKDRSATIRFDGGTEWRIRAERGGLASFFDKAAPEKTTRPNKVRLSQLILGSSFSWLAVVLFAGLLTSQVPGFFYLILLALAVVGAGLAVNRPPRLRQVFQFNRGMSIAVVSGVLIASMGGWGNAQERAEEEAARARSAAREEQAAEDQLAAAHAVKLRRRRELTVLQQELNTNAQVIADQVQQDALLLEGQIADGEWDGVRELASSMRARVQKYGVVPNVPEPVANAMRDTSDVLEQASRALGARDIEQSVIATISVGDALVQKGAYSDADLRYKVVVEALEGIPVDDRHYADNFVGHLNKAEARVRKNRRKADRQRKQVAEAQALRAVCGAEPPRRSDWDGSYVGVERLIKQSAHDPSSIDVEGCTVAVLTKSCWETHCKYRGNNAFGAKVVNAGTFYLGANGVVEMAN